MPIINLNKNFKEGLKVMNNKNPGIIVLTENKFIRGPY